MSFIVHCHGGNVWVAGRVKSVQTHGEAEALRKEWMSYGALNVEIREVDQSRDWNNTADPAVIEAERDEHDEVDGRWDEEEDDGQ